MVRATRHRLCLPRRQCQPPACKRQPDHFGQGTRSPAPPCAPSGASWLLALCRCTACVQLPRGIPESRSMLKCMKNNMTKETNWQKHFLCSTGKVGPTSESSINLARLCGLHVFCLCPVLPQGASRVLFHNNVLLVPQQ